jgi:ubiquinone/menaquinone biosynthesis C-methylase UbiE
MLKNHLEKGKKCLDVGSGSGYLTLGIMNNNIKAFAKMMDANQGVSYGIEHISELVE